LSCIPILSIQFNFKMNSNFEQPNFLTVARVLAAANSRVIRGQGEAAKDGDGGGAEAWGGGGG
jgi:hypothetical protein